MGISTDMLAAFVQVARRRSVSAAATELGVGKSVASKRVAQLESALRTTLFARSTRKIALTAAGEVYLDFATRVLGEMAAAEETLREMRAELTGQIRVTAPSSWGRQVLSKHLPDFLRLHPALEIELMLADRMMDVGAERIDLAFRWTSIPTPGLVAEPLARVDWLVAAAPSYLAQAGLPADAQALATHGCICYWRERLDDRWVLVSPAGERVPVQVRGRYHADSAEAVADAAIAGLGIALLPHYVCGAALQDGRLVAVLPEWTPEARYGGQITALATPERMRLSRNRELLGFLRQRLQPGR